MTEGLGELFGHRLLIISGKGGTGKTAVVAALGMLAASRGCECVVVEVSGEQRLPELLAAEPAKLPAQDGRQPVRLGPGLSALSIDPQTALIEYLELQLPLRSLARFIVERAGIRQLLEAAPGWRELITLGKIWHLQSGGGRSGTGPEPELLIVDAPATGQGLALLATPGVVIDTVRRGRLRLHTDRVQALLRDPARTRVVPVTLAEELPVRETASLCQKLGELGLTFGPILVNAVEDAPDAGVDPDSVQLERASLDLVSPASLRASWEHAVQRAAEQRRCLRELEGLKLAPVVELPYLATGIESFGEVVELAHQLEKAFARRESRP